MKATNNNKLRQGALLALFITSYTPLFLIVIAKQLKDGQKYLCWGGWNKDALWSFATHFGMSFVLAIITIVGVGGILILLCNLNTNLKNGQTVSVSKINNRNSEAVGYIATYIVPFLASDFTSLYESLIFVVVMALIYVIYINSNMILINPLLSIHYSLIEVEFKMVGDSSGELRNALVITDNKNFKEKVKYQIYPIGFKLYYGKERD